jgi:hypothetical protein
MPGLSTSIQVAPQPGHRQRARSTRPSGKKGTPSASSIARRRGARAGGRGTGASRVPPGARRGAGPTGARFVRRIPPGRRAPALLRHRPAHKKDSCALLCMHRIAPRRSRGKARPFDNLLICCNVINNRYVFAQHLSPVFIDRHYAVCRKIQLMIQPVTERAQEI